MARLLVAADLSSLSQRPLAEAMAEQMRSDGHEALLATDAPVTSCRDADGLVALLDGAPAALPIAFAGVAHALGKPALALHTQPLPDALASLFTQTHAVSTEADLESALPAFYAQVRPHAGKLVRDLVPRIVREAGHAIQFREAAPEERPRYLKQKVSEEAAELLAAEPGQEREEVADLLEALEALLRERGFDRDDLKLVKEAKRKRRGAFERCFVVESASAPTAAPAMPAWPSETPERMDLIEETLQAPEPVEESGPLFPPTVAEAAVPLAPSGQSRLWNVGKHGNPEPIQPKREDPDRVEPKLRDL